MNKQYNLYNLEASFKQYLLAGIKYRHSGKESQTTTPESDFGHAPPAKMTNITIKNYLSDFRHFAGWLLNQNSYELITDNQYNQLAALLTIKVIEDYKNYLTKNNVPRKTINRRLSTIRKFCSFCISQGWMKENPAKQVINVVTIRHSEVVASDTTSQNDIVFEFTNDPINKNINLEHINEFFTIINS